VNAVYKESSNSSGNSSDNSLEETDKMKRLVKSWMKLTNTTDIAKVFRKIYNSPESKLLSSKIHTMMDDGATNIMTNEVNARRWNTVFRKDNEFHYIKNEALEYANTL
jgi:RNA polymerase-interacting CarD/CdnL/TRCF family regulator